MKVRLLPLAIGAAIAMPGVAFADGPTVYGKMNVTYEYVTLDDGTNDDSNGELNSNASRLGFKGSEDISDDLSVIYQAEYQISVDGDASTFSQRDIFVGLKGGWGTFQAGKFDTPLKKSQGKVDQFNNMQFGDIKNVIEGENRVGDIVQYSTPSMAGLTATLAFQSDENNDINPGATPEEEGYSLSLVYEADMIFASIAMDDSVAGYDATRLTVVGNMDVFQLGFLYQTAEEADVDNAEEQDGYILSAAMKLGESNKLRAQYGFSETDLTNDTTDEVTQFGIGVDHKLSKQTKLFANYIMIEEENDAPGSVKEEGSTLQVGLEHKF
ncbi:MAG: porin [Pseudomonadales bacterium]|nr:porin [Pseudomonadales bacterium]